MAEGRAVKKTSSSSQGRRGLRESRAARYLLLLLLAACCLSGFYLYSGSVRLIRRSGSEQPDINPARLDMTAQAEAKEVKEAEAAISSLGRASRRVMQSAVLAELSGQQPFGTPEALAAARIPADLPEAREMTDAEASPVQPPMVRVVAVMIQGGERVAMIDAEGEEGGLLVREGSRFSGGSAKITEINPEGVKFTWMKETREAAVSQ